MRYYIVSRDCNQLVSKLCDEILRLDVRAEFEMHKPSKRFYAFSAIKKNIELFELDVLICTDEFKTNQLTSLAKRKGIKSCLIKTNSSTSNTKNFDKVLDVNPENKHEKTAPEHHYIGHYIVDLVKDYTFNPKYDLEEDIVNIAVIVENRKEANQALKVVERIANLELKYQFHFSEQNHIQSGRFDNIHFVETHKYDLLRNCNAALVFYSFASLEAACLNCPQIYVSRKTNPKSYESLVNLMASKRIIKEYRAGQTEKLRDELSQLLEDQHYCANMLAEYQIVKDKIGNERALRNAARIIVEWLESSSS